MADNDEPQLIAGRQPAGKRNYDLNYYTHGFCNYNHRKKNLIRKSNIHVIFRDEKHFVIILDSIFSL